MEPEIPQGQGPAPEPWTGSAPEAALFLALLQPGDSGQVLERVLTILAAHLPFDWAGLVQRDGAGGRLVSAWHRRADGGFDLDAAAASARERAFDLPCPAARGIPSARLGKPPHPPPVRARPQARDLRPPRRRAAREAGQRADPGAEVGGAVPRTRPGPARHDRGGARGGVRGVGTRAAPRAERRGAHARALGPVRGQPLDRNDAPVRRDGPPRHGGAALHPRLRPRRGAGRPPGPARAVPAPGEAGRGGVPRRGGGGGARVIPIAGRPGVLRGGSRRPDARALRARRGARAGQPGLAPGGPARPQGRGGRRHPGPGAARGRVPGGARAPPADDRQPGLAHAGSPADPAGSRGAAGPVHHRFDPERDPDDRCLLPDLLRQPGRAADAGAPRGGGGGDGAGGS